MNQQMKCYIYTRVSTAMQVDGYSLDAQRDKLRKYAEFQKMVVAGEYSDEGFSGKNIQGRKEFQRMLKDIQEGTDGVSYVLVYKLSRFGRNAADVLNSLQLMQDFGVNLICVEDGIDSSKDSGKLMISVLSAVAEIERENIRTQTMAGRAQKAKEGKWNGGFAPYGYKLVDGELKIAEDEVDVIRIIFDRYVHTNEGVKGIASYLNKNGYVKKTRQNNTIPGFSTTFIKDVLDNPVYMGKIAYGRRKIEKRIGTRNEMHVVRKSEFPMYDGQHEAIVSETDWNLAQKKRQMTGYRRETVNDPEHAHILSGLIRCPLCGKALYGNIIKDRGRKTVRYYYYCKNTKDATGHKCSFRTNIEQEELNSLVAKVVSAMVNRPMFVDAIKSRIGKTVDTSELEKQLEYADERMRRAQSVKRRLEQQMDGLEDADPFFEEKLQDLQRRYDEQYGLIGEIEEEKESIWDQIHTIRQEQLTEENIYRLLITFDKVYSNCNEAEQKELMRTIIDYVEIYTEKPKNGCWIKKIVFTFPIPTDEGEVREIALESSGMLETVVQISKGTIPVKYVRVEFNLEEMDMSGFQYGASYKKIQKWIQEKYGFHVTNLNIAQVKQEHGIIERENYNKPKSEDSKQPGCPEEKKAAIEEALRFFHMIG